MEPKNTRPHFQNSTQAQVTGGKTPQRSACVCGSAASLSCNVPNKTKQKKHAERCMNLILAKSKYTHTRKVRLCLVKEDT